MKSLYPCAAAVLRDFYISTCPKKKVQLLTILNDIFKFDRDELSYAYQMGDIISLSEHLKDVDQEMTDSCLKLLLTVTEEDIKIKEDLLKNNIFNRLAGALRRQKNLLGENLILYGALVVTLVHENENAQCQAKSSGCLACLLYILKRLLVRLSEERGTNPSVFLRNLQRVTEDKNPEEISLLLPKITALLVMFKSHRDFLQLASSYCCIVILFNVVNTCNASAMRNVALFLESLTKEVPLSLQLTRSFGRIEKTKIVTHLTKSMKVAFQDGVRDLRYKKILTRIIALITDKVRMSYSDEADQNSLVTETDFCILHGPVQDSLDSVDIKDTSFIALNLKRSQMMRPKRIVKRGGFKTKFIFRSCLGLFINLAVLLLPKIVKNFQD
ncbi:hypothetical protein RUM44_008674 [Polyplax serrata]|uniref:Uncharacterized protein n=1 Tax=Polyplax serrata TaxID=468196 RepID=A0ABR1BDC7_POLSC